MNRRQELDYALITGEIDIKDVLASISCYLEDNEVSNTLYRLKNPIVAALSSEYNY
jgi:hypothetical protein